MSYSNFEILHGAEQDRQGIIGQAGACRGGGEASFPPQNGGSATQFGGKHVTT